MMAPRISSTHARHTLAGLVTVCIVLLLTFAGGCAGTSGTTDDQATKENRQTGPAAGSGTVQEPEFPPGKFTVQLGAYQSEDAARTISSLAGSRFTRQLFTVYDATDRLYKVMLGMFDTKDQARQFRDTIVRQYPGDYSDAWVSELKR